MQRKVNSLEEKVEEIYDYQIYPDEVEKKLTVLKDRSRRNNLRIDGVAEKMVRARKVASERWNRFLWTN